MPIDIYRVTPENERNEAIAWLCDGEWFLCQQVETLSKWLEKTGSTLPEGEYVADIGFCWRRNASAGGPVLDVATMRRMVNVNMSLFLSEYPGFAGEEKSDHTEPNTATGCEDAAAKL